ncbi:MAG: hypothetical protein IT235_05210 [Bacteroidia bacterium]|nr:hypothetical protein [Bacteroidia bacterium]
MFSKPREGIRTAAGGVVFDERLGERISDEIVSTCHQCNNPCDTHTNCVNNDCHLLFIQCDECREKYKGCCTPECKEIVALPVTEQRKLRKGKVKKNAHSVYKSRLRPNLKEILQLNLKNQSEDR